MITWLSGHDGLNVSVSQYSDGISENNLFLGVNTESMFNIQIGFMDTFLKYVQNTCALCLQ